MFNKEEAQRLNDELHRDAMKSQIHDFLAASKVPVRVSQIVKHTGFRAEDIREILLDMVYNGEAKEIAWRYTV